MVLYLPTVLVEIRKVHQRFSTSPTSRCLVRWLEEGGLGCMGGDAVGDVSP